MADFMINHEAFAALNADFFDEVRCRHWILKKLHPGGARCPGCQRTINDGRRRYHFWNGDRLNCEYCGKYFTALTGQIFSGAHLDFKGLFLLAVLSGAGINDKIIAEKLKITPESCRLWRIKFKTSTLFSG
jgi:transposase-like protein